MRARHLAALTLLLAIAGCPGSPGRIVNPVAQVRALVHGSEPVYLETDWGLERVDLRGGGRVRIAPSRYHLLAISDDGAVLAFDDDDTNLYVMHMAGRRIDRIHALDGRTGATAISPDGRLLAVARHADFSRPESTWSSTVDDAIYLVDTRTLAVRRIPPTHRRLVSSLLFSADGRFLRLGLFDFSHDRVDVVTGRRVPAGAHPSSPLSVPGNRRPVLCERNGFRIVPRGFGADRGLDLVAKDGKRRHLVTVAGRRRGFHDYLSTLADPFFSRSCRYVVFAFRDAVYVVSVASGRVARLATGSAPFTLPTGRAR